MDIDWIRERAYHLWHDAGRPDGRTDEFWFAAEQELTSSDTLDPSIVGRRVPPPHD